MIYFSYLNSPVGDVTLIAEADAVIGLHIAGDRYFKGVSAGWTEHPALPVLVQVRQELGEYFLGRRRHFDVPVRLSGTPFQQQVWAALREIPSGSTATYRDIAEQIGRPLATRAVGTAIGRNPACILVPCHRVLASGGGFGGYVAGINCKQHLLSLEGITVAAP